MINVVVFFFFFFFFFLGGGGSRSDFDSTHFLLRRIWTTLYNSVKLETQKHETQNHIMLDNFSIFVCGIHDYKV